MKKFFLSTVFAVTFALFAACGDEVTEVTEIHQDGVAVLDAGLELSKQKCDSTNVGDMLFVTDSSEVFVCDGKTWLTLKGADGDDGDDGESCTAKPVTNDAGLEGIEVTCGKTVVGTIWNGVDGEIGPQGPQGETGEPGVPGTDGDDGKNCEVSREGNVLTIACANSTETINLDDFIQSSSSDGESSSSNVIASCSSVVFPEGVMSAGYYEDNCPAGHTCKDAAPATYLKIGIIYGEILDTRDDQVYKVVTIGEGDDTQTWMAQNLNYAYNEGTAKSYCYDGDLDNCAKYGRLYTWAAAIDSVALANDADAPQTCGYGKICTLQTVVQGVCPEGWHLPSHGEFETLINYIDPDFGYGHTLDASSSTAGYYLKATSGWKDSGNGGDTHGFSALPGGYYSVDNGNFNDLDNNAYFWSSTEYYKSYAYDLSLDYDSDYAYLLWYNKTYARSVRCIKDN